MPFQGPVLSKEMHTLIAQHLSITEKAGRKNLQTTAFRSKGRPRVAEVLCRLSEVFGLRNAGVVLATAIAQAIRLLHHAVITVVTQEKNNPQSYIVSCMAK